MENRRRSRAPQSVDDLERVVEAEEARLEDFRPDGAHFQEALDTQEAFGPDYAVPGEGYGLAVPNRDLLWLEAVALRPDLVARLLECQCVRNCRLIEAQRDLPMRILMGGGDFCGRHGPNYAPQAFRELMLPRLQRMTSPGSPATPPCCWRRAPARRPDHPDQTRRVVLGHFAGSMKHRQSRWIGTHSGSGTRERLGRVPVQIAGAPGRTVRSTPPSRSTGSGRPVARPIRNSLSTPDAKVMATVRARSSAEAFAVPQVGDHEAALPFVGGDLLQVADAGAHLLIVDVAAE